MHEVRPVRIIVAAALLASVSLAGGAAPVTGNPFDLSITALVALDQEQGDQAVPSVDSDATARSHPEWVHRVEAATWPGMLTGMDGFDDFVEPVGMPLYFEDPFIRSDIRLIYIYHSIPHASVLRGGKAQVAAAPIRIALTDRLALLAYKDGYSWTDTGITQKGDGWNDLGIGLKYAFYVDHPNQTIFSGGLKWELENGTTRALQGSEQELAPFVSFAKGWDKWHILAAMTGRCPLNRHRANYSLVWNLHLDYKLTETFRPLVELHGIHWLSDADRLPISEDYLDVGSLGASQAKGRDFFSAGVGFRWEIVDNVNFGVTYEFPLESKSEHLQDYRFTFNTVIRF